MYEEKPYAHKCLCCGVYVNFDRTYCISCEKTLFGNGGVGNGKAVETSGNITSDRDETRVEEE